MARGLENVCENISDQASESLEKSLGAIYKEAKWRNRDKKSS